MKAVAVLIVFLALSCLAVVFVTPGAQQPAVTRKILLKRDAPVPGYEEDLAAVVIPPGGREGRHTHPGSVIVYVQEGNLTLDYDGKPTATYRAGESFYVEPDKIHEGRNIGSVPVKALATFLVKKGVPMTSQAQ